MSEKRPLILAVDDIPENLYIVESVLHDQGYHTVSASSGAEALQQVEQRAFDLILLDILMPEMDGFEVCARLKRSAASRDIPVIFLTALADDDNILRGFEAGGVDYVTKPFRPAELVARVDTHLSLRRKELELGSLNASKDKFISIVANELRQPFAALCGVLGMLHSDYDQLDDDERRDYVELSYHNADNLYKLIKGLMTWSSLQRGLMPFRPVGIDLHAAVDDALHPLAEKIAQKRLSLEVDVAAGADVLADREMLDHVLNSLIANAVMYNVEGGRITLRARPWEGFWRIEVIDTGIGIDPEDLKGLFRIDEDMRRRGTHGEAGTGMGLILSKELVEKQGGEISLTSDGGETCVAFTLPALTSPAEAAD